MSAPQPWNTHTIRIAVAQGLGLIDAFASDVSGEGFRNELDRLVETIGSESGELQDQFALLLYAGAIIGAAALALAAELGREPSGEARAMVGDAVNTWLDNSLAA